MNAASAMTESYDWSARAVIDSAGEKIGKVDEVYYATDDGSPEWLAVNTGLFGTKTSFVPTDGSRPKGEDVQVACTKDQVKDAPGVKPGEELSHSEERELWAHYGLDYGDQGHSQGAVDTTTTSARGAVGRGVRALETNDAMTRSEEEVSVGTRRRDAGKARLRKYVVTEQVTVAVPVRKEMAVLETESVGDGDSASGESVVDEDHAVVLSEEEVVVERKVVPKERVRLATKTVTTEQEVTEQVRRERFETEGDISAS